jgi:NodT family efflux transporter outer membrane factor (OMF) lipoprotein
MILDTMLFFLNRRFRVGEGVVGLQCARGLWVSIMVSALSTACATVGPDYEEPVLDPSIQWSGETSIGTSRVISSNPLDTATLNQWWKTLHDPLLTQLIDRASTGNLDLRVATTRIREARAQRGVSNADRFPTLNASGGSSRSRFSENGFYENSPFAGSTNTLYKAGFDASWEIDLFGRIQRQEEAAQANLEFSEENYRDVLITMSSEIALNYLEIRTQQARLSVAEANRDSQVSSVDLVRSRVDAGETARLDLEQALTNLELTRSTIPSLEISLAQAKNRLSVLLGQPPGVVDVELVERRPIPLASPQVAVGIPAEVLRRRPDIRRAERYLAAATAKIGIATADLYPSLTLFGSVGLESLDAGNFLSSASSVFNVGPSLKWNVFDTGRTRHNINIVSVQQERALIAYEAAVLKALQDVENSIVAYAKEMVRRQSLMDAEKSARNVLAIAQNLYDGGETDFMSVLDSQRSLLNLQDQLAASNGQVTTNVISLFKALGGGWTPLVPEAI